jgi:hypothetical protein
MKRTDRKKDPWLWNYFHSNAIDQPTDGGIPKRIVAKRRKKARKDAAIDSAQEKAS